MGQIHLTIRVRRVFSGLNESILHMQLSTQLSGTWQQWIQDNLARGCSPASLVESMVRENFEPAFAISSVYRLSGASAVQAASASKAQLKRRAWHLSLRAAASATKFQRDTHL